MADSVDTMIDNAVTRASSWGNTVSYYSTAAAEGADTSWNVVSIADGVQKFPGVVEPTMPPPTYGATLTAPSVPTMAEADAFRLALESELDTFFATYFSAADAYEAAVAWVLDALNTNDPDLPGTGFREIWDDARLKVTAQGNGLGDLSLPVTVTHVSAAPTVIDHAEAFSLSRVKADLWQHAAALKVRDLRIEAIEAAGNYIKASVSADLAVLEGQTSLFLAKQQAQATAANWYTALISPSRRDAERAFIQKSELRKFDLSHGDHTFTAVDQKVAAYLQGAENMGKVAQAAQASMNSVISSSTVGF